MTPPISAINHYNNSGNVFANFWNAQAAKNGYPPITPQTLPKVGGVKGVEVTKGVLPGDTQEAIASIGRNGMRVKNTQNIFGYLGSNITYQAAEAGRPSGFKGMHEYNA